MSDYLIRRAEAYEGRMADLVIGKDTWDRVGCMNACVTIRDLLAALERAEAEVRACCGAPEALDPYLPDGWRRENHAWRRASLVVYEPHPARDRGHVMWCDQREGAFVMHRSPGALLAAMAAADAALAKHAATEEP